MTLVSTFVEPVRQLSLVMTTPTFNTFLMVLTGWVFARRRTVTGVILAADGVGTKRHASFADMLITLRCPTPFTHTG